TPAPNLARAYAQQRANAPDPTALIIIDEADRLKTASLEPVRDIFDHGELGLVLIGMPGLEKRLSRYPQLYSRVGFVHAFRPLRARDVRELLQGQWHPPGVVLPTEGGRDEAALAAIIRVTGGNFRLLHRLLTQIARLVEINALQTITSEVVAAARESLVIGTARPDHYANQSVKITATIPAKLQIGTHGIRSCYFRTGVTDVLAMFPPHAVAHPRPSPRAGTNGSRARHGR